MGAFSQININKQLCSAIEDLGFETPTPIQQEVIPSLLENETDLIASNTFTVPIIFI